MFKSLTLPALVAALMAMPAIAQDWTEIDSYWAMIGPDDFFNSSGGRLSDLGAVLQQDRANFHRFGLRQRGDEPDGVFHDRDWRARIPALYQGGHRWAALEQMARDAQPFRVFVHICGYGRTPSVILLVPDWADGHSGCF